LAEIIPDYSDFSDVVKVIKTSDIIKASKLKVLMDSDKNKAIGYLE